MPWKGQSIMDLRQEFVMRSMKGEMPFRQLCVEYGISEKTGYKWKKRFIERGTNGLLDMSKRPRRCAKQISEDAVIEIIKIREGHPYWGPKKIRVLIEKNHKGEEIPSESSIKRILDKAGLTKKKRIKKNEAGNSGSRLRQMIQAEKANDVWCIDFKGYWYSNNEKIIPFTVRDLYSRKILEIRAVETTSTESVRSTLTALFKKYGLPKVIRSDNGEPFASSSNPLGLTKLSVWLISLGIQPDRTKPGKPGQNGSLERMHADMARELEKKVPGGITAYQTVFDEWREEYNSVRPNEAIGMKVPDDLYQPSPRKYTGDPDILQYKAGLAVRRIGHRGNLKFKGHTIFISNAMIGYLVGLQQLNNENDYVVWLAEFPVGIIHLDKESFDYNIDNTGNNEILLSGKAH